MFPKSGGSGKLSSWCRQCHSDRAQVLRMALEQSNLEFFKSDPIEKIESTIRERGITVISVAQAIGVSEQNAYKWFARKTLPRQKNLLAMYQYLGMALLHKSIFGRHDPNPRRIYAIAATSTV